MTEINMDNVEQISDAGNGLHRVYFKSGRDILIDNYESVTNYWFFNHQRWPVASEVASYSNTGPG
jgi:hypothetical protein